MEIIETILIGGAVFIVWFGLSAALLTIAFMEIADLSKLFRRKDD